MSVRAPLFVRLYAGEVLVAESEDAGLWQRVFTVVQKSAAGSEGQNVEHAAAFDGLDAEKTRPRSATLHVRPGQGLDGFAQELGINVDELEGALSPSDSEPFIHLNPHCWEAFKKNTPVRGPGAVSPSALAGTVLSLWFQHAAKPSAPTMAQAQVVLGTISLRDQNPGRGIGNAEWLQLRAGSIVINPAQRSRAVNIASAFCSKRPPTTSGGEK
jgi:hypothetical protein